MMQEVLLCAGHRFWHYWRTIPLLRRTGCDVFDATLPRAVLVYSRALPGRPRPCFHPVPEAIFTNGDY